MTTPVLEFRHISSSYNGAVILQDVSFSIERGETVGLVGRNGAGKSTTLVSVYGLPRVTGDILIDGKKLRGKPHLATKGGVALVPQGKRIFSNLTVEDNLLLGQASARDSEWTLPDLYDLFPNLAKGRKRPGTSLSGGEQQMLAIGRALMSGPSLLMLDEPTEGLAPVMVDAIVSALQQVQERGTALLIVEQHIGLIQKLATRFLALRSGVLVGAGPVSRLSDRAVQELIAL